VIGPLDGVFKGLVLSPFVTERMLSFTVKPNKEDLQHLKALSEAGEITPMIDRSYSLSDIPDAIRYLEEGHPRGKVVVTV
jgi:NADPH:quinone reductase-like Zn-dependent oxidoreductase